MKNLLITSVIIAILVGCSPSIEKTDFETTDNNDGNEQLSENDTREIITYSENDVKEITIKRLGIQSNELSNEKLNITDAHFIKIFIQAIKNAAKMEGILNYQAEFEMIVTFNDNTSLIYDLNLGTDPENEGLLVLKFDNHNGYIIQKQDVQNMREIIYKGRN